MELVRASARVFGCTLIFTIVHPIVLAIACTIAIAIILVGPGFEPLALHTILLVGPGFDSLTLQHDLLWVQGLIPWPDHLFQARSIRGLCQSPPQLEDQVGLWKNKSSMRKKIL